MNLAAAEISRRLVRTLGKEVLSENIVREWCKRFKNGD